MGEYANFNGQRIKIGTCENMYYLRWDQRHLVTQSETPLFDEKVLGSIRFRFPFPDEDGIRPGEFVDAFRGWRLDGFEVPKDVEHGTVQFTAQNGYLVSLPCPEGPDTLPNVHRNGYGGAAALVQQAWRGGRLVGIARCNGCHALYRLEDGYEEAAAVAIRAHADKYEGGARASWIHDMADRLLAGYSVTVSA